MRIAIAQINCTVGDLNGNTRKILEFIEKGKKLGCDIVSFPELAITGYPPEDLLLKPQFIEDNLKCLKEITKQVDDIVVIVGFVDKKDDIYNAAAILHNKSLIGVYYKQYLPNYKVFDEKRYFQTGTESSVFTYKGVTFGVNICEDIWYPEGPAVVQTLAGDADIIFSINSSPYHMEKWKSREKMLRTRASDNFVFVVYSNLVGGQDELVFDGHSMIFGPAGDLIARGKQFEEDFLIVDLDTDTVLRRRLSDPQRQKRKIDLIRGGQKIKRIVIPDNSIMRKKVVKLSLPEPITPPPHPIEEVYKALVLGLHDYVKKNGFEKVVIGLSGGIDSAITAVVAADALGKKNVIGVYMPSRYSSDESEEDAKKLSANLGIEFKIIPIQYIFDSYLKTLKEEFHGFHPNVTEENLQARTRGNILMALSNKFGWLVLSTGNKSEMSVGYATLYGDMSGGFNVIKDVPKTLVYKLAKYRNSQSKVMPERIIEKEPTAELRPDQKDTDSLPPYSILDPIMRKYVEEDASFKELVSKGYPADVVEKIIKLVDSSEYKRRQAPPGIRITPRAFGKDRRMPITNLYKISRKHKSSPLIYLFFPLDNKIKQSIVGSQRRIDAFFSMKGE